MQFLPFSLGDQLFYVGLRRNQHRLVLFKEEERANVFKDCHDSSHGGHFGRRKTLQKIEERFYWPSMTTYVDDQVTLP